MCKKKISFIFHLLFKSVLNFTLKCIFWKDFEVFVNSNFTRTNNKILLKLFNLKRKLVTFFQSGH